MSAFLCSAKHISVLANASKLPSGMRLVYIDEFLPAEVAAGARAASGQSDEEALFNLLADENLKSVSYRYPDATKISDWTSDANFSYDCRAHVRTAVEVIKLAHSYEYQACEHPEWKESAAKRYVDRLISAWTRELPGYDDAEWSI